MQYLFRVCFFRSLVLLLAVLSVTAGCKNSAQQVTASATPTAVSPAEPVAASTPLSTEVYEVRAKKLNTEIPRFCAILQHDVAGTDLKSGFYVIIQRGSDGAHTVINMAPEFKEVNMELKTVSIQIPEDTKVTEGYCG